MKITDLFTINRYKKSTYQKEMQFFTFSANARRN